MSHKSPRKSFRASASVAPLAFAMFATCGPGCAPPSAPTQQSGAESGRGPKTNMGEQPRAEQEEPTDAGTPAIQEAPGV
ncbi:MAG: hypothetical protein ACPHRO_05490, partial [Nannocystaceae bacterium]